jgi:hypothetical protein
VSAAATSSYLAHRRPQQLWQLGDVGDDAPGLVAGEQPGRRSTARLVLEIDVGERLPSSRTLKEALVSSADHCGGKRCLYVRAAGRGLTLAE